MPISFQDNIWWHLLLENYTMGRPPRNGITQTSTWQPYPDNIPIKSPEPTVHLCQRWQGIRHTTPKICHQHYYYVWRSSNRLNNQVPRHNNTFKHRSWIYSSLRCRKNDSIFSVTPWWSEYTSKPGHRPIWRQQWSPNDGKCSTAHTPHTPHGHKEVRTARLGRLRPPNSM